MLADLLEPWAVDTIKVDYGLDVMVHLTDEVLQDGTSHPVTGRKFSAQLRATSKDEHDGDALVVRIETKHLNYWMNSTEPVMLIRAVLANRRLYGRWIDAGFIGALTARNPGWDRQGTVDVRLDERDLLDAARVSGMAGHVASWQARSSFSIAPGEYLALHAELEATYNEARALAVTARVTSVAEELRALSTAFERITYRVNLVGRSRAGKSTLFNYLCGASISPVDFHPTTAVELRVLPGAEASARVIRADGPPLAIEPTAKAIEKYATQKSNRSNHRGVDRIEVLLPNPLLRAGICLCDSPGFQDPDPTMSAIAARSLEASHAVLYLLDGTPYRSGGLVLTRDDVTALSQLSKRADRLFVLVTKSDELDPDQVARLRDYLATELERAGIARGLPSSPLFISTKSATKALQQADVEAALDGLLAKLWGYLLERSRLGITRLGAEASRLVEITRQIEAHLGAELALADAAADAAPIEKEMSWVRTRRTEMLTRVADAATKQRESTAESIEARFSKLSPLFRSWVLGAKTFPNQPTLQQWAVVALTDALTHERKVIEEFGMSLREEIDTRISDVVRHYIALVNEMPTMQIPVPSATDFIVLPERADATPLWWTLGGLVLGTIVEIPFVGAAVAGGFAVFAAIFNRKAARVKRAVTEFEKYRQHAGDIGKGRLDARVVEIEDALSAEIKRRLDAHLNDLERQLRGRGGRVLSPSERSALEQARASATDLTRRASSLRARIAKASERA